jgi:hypothetical protein
MTGEGCATVETGIVLAGAFWTASVSGIARQYGIAARLLFRRKREPAPVIVERSTPFPLSLIEDRGCSMLGALREAQPWCMNRRLPSQPPVPLA